MKRGGLMTEKKVRKCQIKKKRKTARKMWVSTRERERGESN